MICFPNIKINIGLNILFKRKDGFHAIESVFYPVSLTDVLELIPAKKTKLTVTGIPVKGDLAENLCIKAYELLASNYKLPPVQLFLHKIIPMGAGLGGGSSDAAFVIKSLNTLLNLKLSDTKMRGFAAQLGSDCPFFIYNKPAFVTGRGEHFENIDISLNGYYILLVHPNIHVNTAAAFRGIEPRISKRDLKADVLHLSPEKWTGIIHNQFEETVFVQFPEIEKVKDKLYNAGAIYASMSGSGSAVYGLFKKEIEIPSAFKNYYTWLGKL